MRPREALTVSIPQIPLRDKARRAAARNSRGKKV